MCRVWGGRVYERGGQRREAQRALGFRGGKVQGKGVGLKCRHLRRGKEAGGERGFRELVELKGVPRPHTFYPHYLPCIFCLTLCCRSWLGILVSCLAVGGGGGGCLGTMQALLRCVHLSLGARYALALLSW